MNGPPPELARLVRAHRIVHRPDPELRERVHAAVHRAHRRAEARRWIGGAFVGAALGVAALLALRCAIVSPSRVQSLPTQVDAHGAAYERESDTAPRSSVLRSPGAAREGSPGASSIEAETAGVRATPEASSPRGAGPLEPVAPSGAAPRAEASPHEAMSAVDAEREVRLLRQAEVGLRDDPEAALELLRRHEREFPTTTIGVEREALTVLALCGAGRRIEGRGRRAAFLKTHAGSVYAARVRSACEGD